VPQIKKRLRNTDLGKTGSKRKIITRKYFANEKVCLQEVQWWIYSVEDKNGRALR
jgi:hypothetical protein